MQMSNRWNEGVHLDVPVPFGETAAHILGRFDQQESSSPPPFGPFSLKYD